MGAAAALFVGILVLMGVQMALGRDPAIGASREAGATHQKAQRGGSPVLPPSGDSQAAQPSYPGEEQYYGEPSGNGGYYDQAPPAYGDSQQYQQQPGGQQQYAPPVQSGPS